MTEEGGVRGVTNMIMFCFIGYNIEKMYPLCENFQAGFCSASKIIDHSLPAGELDAG